VDGRILEGKGPLEELLEEEGQEEERSCKQWVSALI
jgi:hypothetical protein